MEKFMQTRYDYFWTDLIQLQKVIPNLSKKGHISTTFYGFLPGKYWNIRLFLMPSFAAVLQLFLCKFCFYANEINLLKSSKNMLLGLFLALISALTNSLAQIFTWLWFLWFCSRTKRFYIHPNPNPNPNHNPEAIHNSNPNPSPKQSNSCLTSLSRDQNSVLSITLQGSIFTLRHDSESAFKNTPI